jgi:putative transferase (TIGR04331 family)
MNNKELILYKDIISKKKTKKFLFGNWLINSYKDDFFYIIKSNFKNTSPIEDSDDGTYKQALRFVKLLSYGLNQVLNLNENQTYWKTVLYPWLYYYCNFITCISRRVEKILNLDNSLNCKIVNYDKFKKIVPYNFDNFNELSGNELWNGPIIFEIFSYLEKKKNKKLIQFNHIKKNKRISRKKFIPVTYNTVKDRLLNIFFYINNFFPIRKTQPFIISPYLPSIHEALLKMSYFSMPKKFKSPEIKYTSANFKIRKKLIKILLNNKKLKPYDIIAIKNLFNCLPLAYLENHISILKETQKIKWPSKPKFIFTSNNHIWDEFFKIWSAKQRSRGTPFFVGQHGANFGTNKSSIYYCEEVVPDKLFTWGWSFRKSFHVPTFNTKI